MQGMNAFALQGAFAFLLFTGAVAQGPAPGPASLDKQETVHGSFIISNLAFEEVAMVKEAFDGVRGSVMAFTDKHMENAVAAGPGPAPGPASNPPAAPVPAAALVNLRGQKSRFPVLKSTSAVLVNSTRVASAAPGPAPLASPAGAPGPAPMPDNVGTFVALSEGPVFEYYYDEEAMTDAEVHEEVHEEMNHAEAMEGHMEDKEHKVAAEHTEEMEDSHAKEKVNFAAESEGVLLQKKARQTQGARLAKNSVRVDVWVAPPPGMQGTLEAEMKKIWTPNNLGNVLLHAEGIDWHNAPVVEKCDVSLQVVQKFQLDCAPHVEQIINRFALSYTRRQVPVALEHACHLFESKISFSGNNMITKWDRRACKIATEKLMNKWQGGNLTDDHQGGYQYKANYTKPDYSGWCHDLCELKLGIGAPQCHL